MISIAKVSKKVNENSIKYETKKEISEIEGQTLKANTKQSLNLNEFLMQITKGKKLSKG